MSRTDKDRPFWVISNDPKAVNNVIKHYCGRQIFGEPEFFECHFDDPRPEPRGEDRWIINWQCGYYDPREAFWYREIDGPRHERARDRNRLAGTLQEAQKALRDGEFDEFADDYDWGYSDRRRQEWAW